MNMKQHNSKTCKMKIFSFPSEKIDVLSTEKNGNKQRKMALFRALTLALNVGSWVVQG